MAKSSTQQQAHIQGLLKGGKTKKRKNKAKESRSKTSRSGNGTKLKY
tara:strand:- start:33 stop:173 length:141 start_codon:yes stop_codon:yes gene_type:complete